MSKSPSESTSALQQSIISLLDATSSVDFSSVQTAIDKAYIKDPQAAPEEIARAITSQQSLMSGLLGAGTGFLGAPFIVATLPADLVKMLKFQTFTIYSVACAYGYSDKTTDLKTDVSLILANNSFDEIRQSLKQLAKDQIEQVSNDIVLQRAAAAQATKAKASTLVKSVATSSSKQIAQVAVKLGGNALRDHALKQVPQLLRGAVWSVAGKKIAEKTIQRGVSRAVPVLGAVVGGGLDWWAIQKVGDVAIDYYKNDGPEYYQKVTKLFSECASLKSRSLDG